MHRLYFSISVILIGNTLGEEYQCNILGQCQRAQISHLITTSTPLECLQSCVGFDDCKWYTFKGEENEFELNCELFKTCETIADNCYGHSCISGQNTCPMEKCELDGLCLGTVITSRRAVIRLECDYFCKTEPTCNYYSFNAKNNNCYLFQDCPSIDETVAGFQSSQVGCPSFCDNQYSCDRIDNLF